MPLKPLLFCLACFPLLAWADASRPGQAEPNKEGGDAWQFKLTPSYYSTSHQTAAYDLNLRADLGPHAFWLADYRRGNEFEQARTGYEFTWTGQYVRVIPSLQLATHGFHGGAVNMEVGEDLYGLLGYGRTNAKDYYNLNFDPNDSVTLGLGKRWQPGSSLLFYTVRDNRLHTEQVVNHLVFRIELAPRQRLTLDASSKHGRASPEDDKVHGDGLSVTYDYRDVFLRVAYDRKVNFTADDQTRVTLGLRF